MPALSLYALDEDFATLVRRLNEDEAIAFIQRIAGDQWRTTRTLDHLPDGDTWLWHVPAGPLRVRDAPARLGDVLEVGAPIESPWEGWMARGPPVQPEPSFASPAREGLVPSALPYTPGPETLTLQVYRDAWPDDRIAITSLQWIGDHSAVLGQRASLDTHRWWKGMERWLRKTATRISRTGGYDSTPLRGLVAYALPVAFAAIVRGRARSEN
jgi:hypothetical protein